MRSISCSNKTRSAFTVVELVVVVAVIAVLIGLLIPALSQITKMAETVAQKAQFTSISVGLETYSNDEMGDYPGSTFADDYTGAQRLAEAMVGLDGMGFHPKTRWDGDDISGGEVAIYDYADLENRAARKGPYLELDTANAIKVEDIYSALGSFVAPNTFILADKFKNVRNITTRKKIGMPILYFKANTLPLKPNYPNTGPQTPSEYAYCYSDNEEIVNLGVPFDSDKHPMYHENGLFYKATTNPNYSNPTRPHNNESFILLSAGPDGYYGTSDDIYNFETD